jgi:hypothetical protein
VATSLAPASASGSLPCVCKGNWRLILSETEHLLDRQFRDARTGEVWRYFGLVHGGDDYYYGMWNGKTLKLLSCVGGIESYELDLVPAPSGDGDDAAESSEQGPKTVSEGTAG